MVAYCSFCSMEMAFVFLIVTLFASTYFDEVYATKQQLTVGGLVNIDIGEKDKSCASVKPAVEVALERINNHSDLLQDYTLDVEWKKLKVGMR